MDEELIQLFKDLVDGLKKQSDIFSQAQKVNTWMRDSIGIALGRFAERTEAKEKPFDIKPYLEQKESQKESTPNKTKGVETMKKNCYRRTDGRWQYSKQQGGYKYYAIANTYRELLEKIPKIKPTLTKSVKHKTKKTNQNTFLQYYQFYIDNYVKNKKIGEESLKDWQRQLTRDLTPEFKYLKLEDITTEKIQNFINNIDKERKQETLYQRITKVLKKAYATGKIKRDITLGVEKPKRKNKQERNPLKLHEQIQLLKAVKKSKIYTFVVFSIIIGSRREETMRFNLSDIDEKKQTIHIRGTKTSNADRYVYVTKEFIKFLKSNLPKGKFDFNISYPTHELGEIFKKLNMKGACLHSLRHTCSANLYFLGANDKYRQMQLGHASIVTTNDIYTNIKENITPRRLRLIYGDLYPKFD
jgi:integrase